MCFPLTHPLIKRDWTLVVTPAREVVPRYFWTWSKTKTKRFFLKEPIRWWISIAKTTNLSSNQWRFAVSKLFQGCENWNCKEDIWFVLSNRCERLWKIERKLLCLERNCCQSKPLPLCHNFFADLVFKSRFLQVKISQVLTVTTSIEYRGEKSRQTACL